MKKNILLILAVSLLFMGCNFNSPDSQKSVPSTDSPNHQKATLTYPKLDQPIVDALSRITKKTFGLYVSPKNSPVSPEKFTGFHTGVDFETLPNEQNIDVPIFAVCEGKLLLKKYATGYGGVAVQSCKLDNQDVTVIYGHLNLASITPNIGDELKTGDKLGALGKGYSTETSGERKHLHLGIHKGTSVNILGYVQKQSDLNGWLDASLYLK